MHRFMYTLTHPLDHWETSGNKRLKIKLYKYIDFYQLPEDIIESLFKKTTFNVLDWDVLLYLCCAQEDDYLYFAKYNCQILIDAFLDEYKTETNRYVGGLLHVDWQTCRRWYTIISKAKTVTLSTGLATIFMQLLSDDDKQKITHFISKISPHISEIMKEYLL